ncbi:subtilisin-like serine protease [Chloropicon primus]|uniref:Subtilisin-like serine protease n=1 Tax=Chloropicon primus TaxID=1764295 RepID=A0A5B8ME35_9CHLO|nr:subtilisin-like serine protease [Chloropicon primus]|eukprot:QDZ18647.1 subtilisin-like serine protease [Chloropicon primus]
MVRWRSTNSSVPSATLAFVLGLAVVVCEAAVLDRSSRQVWLRTGTIDVLHEKHATFPPSTKRRALSGLKDCDSEAESLRQYIITLRGEATEGTYEEIMNAFDGEGSITSYLPDNSYLVFAKPRVVKRVEGLAVWIGDFHADYKVPRDLVRPPQSGISANGSAVRPNLSFFDVHLPHNLDQLGLKSCVGHRGTSKVLAENFCRKAKRNTEAVACSQAASSRLVVGVTQEGAGDFVSWAAVQHEVHSLAYTTRLKQHNHHANSIMQCGAATDAGNIESPSYQQTYLPAWSSGLRGENQIVGMADSGLDFKSCFFRDPDVDVKFEKDSTGEKVFKSTKHRSVDMYRCHGDCKDSSGHGTHVAGTLLGESTSGTFASKYNGVAPKSRVAFTDIGKTAFNTLSAPSLSEDLFPASYARGARIHSDSWSSDDTQDALYGMLSKDADEFTWKNQDFLSVFPVGNDGNSNYFYGVSNPAVAKNVVAVGATMNYEKGKTAYVASGISHLKISGGVYFDVKHASSFDALEAHFGGAAAYRNVKGMSYAMVGAKPLKACDALYNADDVKGKVVIIERGMCPFTEKARNAQTAGAKAVLIYNNKEKGFYYMAGKKTDPGDDITIPSYSISLRYGQQVINAFEDGESLQVLFQGGASDVPTYETLAEYSSVGPTFDERIKPEILAPGNLVSAGVPLLSRKSCYVKEQSGTSMAVPVVSGAAVLIRQYFTEGRHKVDGVSQFTHPSGALIKAVLLNGAKPLDGYSEAGYPMNEVPSFEQGFGRVLLKRSLPLDSSFKLFVQDAVAISTGDVHSYCIETGDEGKLDVTLVWYDPPADLLSSKSIVNDLDLTVHSVPRNYDFFGNNVVKGDRVNTVEQVSLNKADEGRYIVQVKAHKIVQPGQRYAVVASGQFVTGDSRCTKSRFARIISKAVNQRSNERDMSFEMDVYDSVNQRVVNADDSAIMCKFSDCESTSIAGVHHKWRSCGKQESYTNLGDGYHCFRVRYDDGLNTQSGSDDFFGFLVDTLPPVSTIVSSPDALSAKRDAVFTFSASDAYSVNTTYECELRKDGSVTEAWKECLSPLHYTDLDDGSFTFTVKAKDDIGNQETLGSSWTWVVDTLGPKTVISESAPKFTNATSVTFTFSSPDQNKGNFAGFKCGVVDGYASNPVRRERMFESHWKDCESPHEVKGLADGVYIFGVKAYDVLGNFDESPEFHDFEVDTIPPTVSIDSRPPLQTNAESLVFRFLASDTNAKSSDGLDALCSFGLVSEEENWEPCTSPRVFMRVEEGLYQFKVKARDQAGNVGEFDETYVHIDRSPPDVNVTTTMKTIRRHPEKRRVTITVDVDDGPGSGEGSTQCRLKKQIAAAPMYEVHQEKDCHNAIVHDLVDGTYFFEVTASDEVGNEVFYVSDPIVVDTVPPSLLMGPVLVDEENGGSVSIVFANLGLGTPFDKNSSTLYTCVLQKLARGGGACWPEPS